MKLTIIPNDKAVYKDNVSYLDLTFDVPANIHALQWNENIGWIEFKLNADGSKPENEVINELPSWANSALSAWESFDYAIKNPPAPTDEQLILDCKNKAKLLLQDTDWSEIPSVIDTSKPQYLLNHQEFVAYRDQIRALVINPVKDPVWPVMPNAQWSLNN